ncbi:hypothetical protein CSKR_104386 [Clonorchis sinensis]|uniref:Uncharacterized protein n=1 Tax=Clonorchis sinensis TaxID=79923 RepID=A0A419PLL1_CLOSI|nr:hypothetical protein CSKR_104386 [Clonorchis sinensis]
MRRSHLSAFLAPNFVICVNLSIRNNDNALHTNKNVLVAFAVFTFSQISQFAGVYRLPVNRWCINCSLPSHQLPLSLDNLVVSQPKCFLRVAWQLGTERTRAERFFLLLTMSGTAVRAVE